MATLISHFMDKEDEWVNEKKVSSITGVSCSTLQKHRHRGIGIPYVKIGNAVRYSLKAVHEFMRAHQISTKE